MVLPAPLQTLRRMPNWLAEHTPEDTPHIFKRTRDQVPSSLAANAKLQVPLLWAWAGRALAVG